jgi:tetratricopeptide (TPR) repeat protein
MTRVGAVALVAAVVLAAAGCRQTGGGAAAAGPHAEERALIEQGRYDEALSRLGTGDDSEGLYLLGRAWAGKAGPPTNPVSESLSPQEQQALGFYEKAVAANPANAEAQRAIGDLLAPHALAGLRPGSRAVPAPPGVGERSVDRVLGAYGAALQADMDDTGAVSALIDFAIRAGRLREARSGFEELVRRDRENPDVLVRYGDFLAGPMDDPQAAAARYAQALIWRPDDGSTRRKIARIHLDAASEHLEKREYPAAEEELREARKFVADAASPEAARAKQIEAAIAEVRGRR